MNIFVYNATLKLCGLCTEPHLGNTSYFKLAKHASFQNIYDKALSGHLSANIVAWARLWYNILSGTNTK